MCKKPTNFSLNYQINKRGINIIFNSNISSTSSLPLTRPILMAYLPTILSCKCFNDSDAPFHEEILNTPLGHLFEHILINCMAQIKLTTSDIAIFNGRTYWHADDSNPQTFFIKISCKNYDLPIFIKSLPCAINIMNKIILSAQTQRVESTPVLPTSLLTTTRAI